MLYGEEKDVKWVFILFHSFHLHLLRRTGSSCLSNTIGMPFFCDNNRFV